MPRPRCKCGQPITNPLARRCAVCRMLTNFHDANCAVFAHYKNDCNCGADAVMNKAMEQAKARGLRRPTKMTDLERRTAQAQQRVLEAVQITTVLEGRPIHTEEVEDYLDGERSGLTRVEVEDAISQLQQDGLISFENSPTFATWGWVPSGYPSAPRVSTETTPVNASGHRAQAAGGGQHGGR